MGWRLSIETDFLWTQVFRDKYVKEDAAFQSFKSRTTDSIQWRRIVKAVEVLNQGIARMVSSGKQTNFWTDKWLAKDNLEKYDINTIEASMRTKKVAAYWDKERGWNKDELQHYLPEEMLNRLEYVTP